MPRVVQDAIMSLAIGTSILSSIVSTVSAATTVFTAADGSALTRARNYATVQPSRQNATTTGGEADGHHWWMEHAELFEAARIEYGTLHPSLYNFHDHASEFIQPTVLRAIEECERAAAVGQPVDEAAVHALLTPAGAPNVWRLPLLTERFCEMLLEELRHYEASGIPLRRPNGMNRFGAILDQLGLEASMDYLSHRFVRPLGQLLFPWLIGATDADEHYAFVVKYKRGEDVALAEHADASVLTLNVNLGVRGFTGGELGFRGTRWVDAKPQQVAETLVDFAAFQPGDAILHLGGQVCDLPISPHVYLCYMIFSDLATRSYTSRRPVPFGEAHWRWRACQSDPVAPWPTRCRTLCAARRGRPADGGAAVGRVRGRPAGPQLRAGNERRERGRRGRQGGCGSA